MRLRRRVEDRHGVGKAAQPPVRHGRRRGRSRTAGEDDFDATRRAKNQGHGHSRDERRSAREES